MLLPRTIQGTGQPNTKVIYEGGDVVKEVIRTTHCVPYGNPVITAGPNARAVFTAPPV